MLRAAADGLDRGPHVLIAGHEVPARGKKLGAADAASVVDFLGSAGEAVNDGLAPRDIAVPFDDGMGVALLEGFFRKEGGVDSTVDDPGSAFAGDASDFVAAEGIAGMDADADDVSGMNGFGDNLLDGFVGKDGIACDGWRGGGEDEQPSRSDDRCSKRIVAGIDEVDAHNLDLSACKYGGLTESVRVERIRVPACGWGLSACRDLPPGQYHQSYRAVPTAMGRADSRLGWLKMYVVA
jgi:hypothetical protein